MVEEGELRDQLTSAIDGKGAFRRFKDVLMTYSTERERWFAFRSERLRVFMEAWLTAHGWLPPLARFGRRTRRPSRSWCKRYWWRAARAAPKRCANNCVSFPTRSAPVTWKRVTAFAEFVKARRAARGFAHRTDASSSSADSDAPLPLDSGGEGSLPVGGAEKDAADDEEATPSSRKRPAAR